MVHPPHVRWPPQRSNTEACDRAKRSRSQQRPVSGLSGGRAPSASSTPSSCGSTCRASSRTSCGCARCAGGHTRSYSCGSVAEPSQSCTRAQQHRSSSTGVSAHKDGAAVAARSSRSAAHRRRCKVQCRDADADDAGQRSATAGTGLVSLRHSRLSVLELNLHTNNFRHRRARRPAERGCHLGAARRHGERRRARKAADEDETQQR